MNYTYIDVYNFRKQLTTGNASAAPRINDDYEKFTPLFEIITRMIYLSHIKL